MSSKKKVLIALIIIVIVIASVLCGVLLGCKNKSKDEPNSQVPPTTTIDPEEKPDDDDDQIIIRPPDVLGRNFSGLCLKTEIQDGEYDIDDVYIDVLYGVDILRFNISLQGAIQSEYVEKAHIFVAAYNVENYEYYDEETDKYFHDIELERNLRSVSVGEINNGALLIDGVSCIEVDEDDFDVQEQASEECKFAYNLRGTDYEGMVKHDPYSITCYTKRTVKLPRELFTVSEGQIRVVMNGYIFYGDDHPIWIVPNHYVESFRPTIGFDYKVDGDKITISNVDTGPKYIFDGSKNHTA